MKVRFPARVGFYETVKQRVFQHLEENNLQPTGDRRMFIKTGLILGWLVISYVYLVFYADSLVSAVIAAFAVAQGFFLVGFNIMHDGAHGSYSNNRIVNRLMGFTLDLVGGNHFIWRQQHNILHHTYTNIHDMDYDIQTGGVMRLSPDQDWRPWHRLQHIYGFPIYSFLTIAWMFYYDFRQFITGRIGLHHLPKPSKNKIVLFFLAKAFYIGYVLILPLYLHPPLYVLLTFLGIHLILGFTITVVFQLAHTVEGNAFPAPDTQTGVMDNEWAIHEVETTANFAPTNKLAGWLLGGLNYQIEHHLFPKICHIHYPSIRHIVRHTCEEFGVSYVSYPSVRAAVVAHYRFLKKMGCSLSPNHPV